MSALAPTAPELLWRHETTRWADMRHMHGSKVHRHSIASSARANAVGAASIASALAALRLNPSLNLVGPLYRQLRRLRAFQNLPRANPYLMKSVGNVLDP